MRPSFAARFIAGASDERKISPAVLRRAVIFCPMLS